MAASSWPAVLLAIAAGCGPGAATTNNYLAGDWLDADAAGPLEMRLVAGRDGVEGSGSGGGLAAFTVSSIDRGHLRWTFADGTTMDLEVVLGPARTCPTEPLLMPWTVTAISLRGREAPMAFTRPAPPFDCGPPRPG